MPTTPGSFCRLSPLPRPDDRARLDGASETTGTFGRNVAQLSVHMLSPRDPKTSSVEQNLDGEPSWDGRESAGPDNRGHGSAELTARVVNLTQVDPPGDVRLCHGKWRWRWGA